MGICMHKDFFSHITTSHIFTPNLAIYTPNRSTAILEPELVTQGSRREGGAHDVDMGFIELLRTIVKAAAVSLGVQAQGCNRL